MANLHQKSTKPKLSSIHGCNWSLIVRMESWGANDLGMAQDLFQCKCGATPGPKQANVITGVQDEG